MPVICTTDPVDISFASPSKCMGCTIWMCHYALLELELLTCKCSVNYCISNSIDYKIASEKRQNEDYRLTADHCCSLDFWNTAEHLHIKPGASEAPAQGTSELLCCVVSNTLEAGSLHRKADDVIRVYCVQSWKQVRWSLATALVLQGWSAVLSVALGLPWVWSGPALVGSARLYCLPEATPSPLSSSTHLSLPTLMVGASFDSFFWIIDAGIFY